MPTYEYRCTACAHRFEAIQKMTDTPLDACPQCGGKVKRLIGAGAGLLFKGSGFYITDYRSESYKKAKASESSGSSTPAAKPAAAAPTSPTSKPASAAKD